MMIDRNSAAAAALCFAAILAPSLASAHEADQYMIGSCAFIPKVEDCPQQRQAFRDLYKKAFTKNGVDARRQLALMLWKGKSGVVISGRWPASCSWYMVINALDAKDASPADLQNMKTVCSLVSADQVPQVKAQASDIGHRIIAGGKIDESVSD